MEFFLCNISLNSSSIGKDFAYTVNTNAAIGLVECVNTSPYPDWGSSIFYAKLNLEATAVESLGDVEIISSNLGHISSFSESLEGKLNIQNSSIEGIEFDEVESVNIIDSSIKGNLVNVSSVLNFEVKSSQMENNHESQQTYLGGADNISIERSEIIGTVNSSGYLNIEDSQFNGVFRMNELFFDDVLYSGTSFSRASLIGTFEFNGGFNIADKEYIGSIRCYEGIEEAPGSCANNDGESVAYPF